ncbi:MAG: resolvase [Thaumarchaeota archaeon]|nr:resolvase [Nitrososphaerota archaeon]
MPAAGAREGTGAASRARRRRGYSWEGAISRRFNALEGWSAFRLGSPSAELPDVLALNPAQSAAFVRGAKSRTANRRGGPAEQVERWLRWEQALGPYRVRRVVLAFKFLSKRRVARGEYDARKLREYYKEWDVSVRPIECVCHYDGSTYGRDGGERVALDLGECDVPIARARAAQGI